MNTRSVALTLLALCAAPLCLADTIYLKKGSKIEARNVREEGGAIKYEQNGTTFSIPLSWVERVEVDGSSFQGAEGADEEDEGSGQRSGGRKGDAASSGSAESMARPDAKDLARAERQGPGAAASTYFDAGRFEFERGNVDQAIEYFERAHRFLPQNAPILSWQVSALIRAERYREALPLAERLVKLAPNAPEALNLLAMAQYKLDRVDDAIRNWKRSLRQRPDANVEQMLAKADRESAAEATFGQRETSNFSLRFQGSKTPPRFTSEILETLEAHYKQLEHELGKSPRDAVVVTLYTRQTFFDVTQAPAWSGAVNDGRLRIPVEGLGSMTPELARVLLHELAHSFVNEITARRAPGWLHEGVAQMVEGRSSLEGARAIAALFAQKKQIPMRALERHFSTLSAERARLAYAQAQAATEYIRERHGMQDLVAILERIGAGATPEQALQAVTGSNYAEFERELGAYLARTYGP
ncbi:MAG: tetratricopeptide repeat protein [Acidobacteria bacterium]|nr:tetratricopeptide repeat protein [Acidobacteriota bacterium]